MRTKIRFTDQLRERGFIDQWGFMLFAASGFIGIVLAKWFDVAPEWVAVGASVAMIGYALLVGTVGTGRLRADQTGDNCYYLGLIYTLASLSYAIFTFDPNNAASTIIQGFGIALVTTILGLVLRVFFNQGRPDLENIESQVQLEFMEATSRLKSELSAVVQSMNDLSRQLGQSMQEIHATAKTTIDMFAIQTTNQVAVVTAAATEAIEAQSKDFSSRSKRQLAALDTLLVKLETVADSLDGVRDTHVALAETARSTFAAAESTRASVDGLGSAFARNQDTVNGAVEKITLASTQLSASASDFKVSAAQVHAEMIEQIRQIRSHSADAEAAAAQVFQQAAAALNNRIEQSAALYEGLSRQVQTALSTADAHNTSLEEELARSREIVARVHGSLAEMTESLARAVEQKA
ncbi:hypothetical protein K3217_21050 [bacterium BD-1]|nr:hypothetical protein [Ottowia caeni]